MQNTKNIICYIRYETTDKAQDPNPMTMFIIAVTSSKTLVLQHAFKYKSAGAQSNKRGEAKLTIYENATENVDSRQLRIKTPINDKTHVLTHVNTSIFLLQPL